jgi:hypothetical protein
MSPISPEDGNRSSFRNVVFSSFYNTGRWAKSENSVIWSPIYRCQNPLKSTSPVSLYNVKDFILVIVTQCVSSEVGTEFVNII